MSSDPVPAPARGTDALYQRNSRRCCFRRRAEQAQRHGLQVLHDGGEVELVASAGQTAQAHALEAVMGLKVGEPHLDALPLIAGLGERLGFHLAPRYVAGILVKIARDLACISRGAALRSERADIAITFRGTVEQ